MRKDEIESTLEKLKDLTGIDLKLTKEVDGTAQVKGTVSVKALSMFLEETEVSGSRERFYRAVISGMYGEDEVRTKAAALSLNTSDKRAVVLVETKSADLAAELIRQLFPCEEGNDVFAIDRDNVILIRALGAKKSNIHDDVSRIVSAVNTELMENVRAAYGDTVNDISLLKDSYEEARTAMEVAGMFYEGMYVIPYNSLGLGRLIYAIPAELCERFLKDSFRGKKKAAFNEEELKMINSFFERDLNISETARALFLHRNTLVYHLEKLKKKTGLDIRHFDDALTLKLILMMSAYLEWVENRKD
jgi:carbohydrate diacid regulator